jgi:eukaryotic-like serine/threonine-protein kinase
VIGKALGHYQILDRLGEGGMGEVYRAADTNLKRQVAIKVLPASVATDADRLARFQREAEVLAALNHPNIAQIFGVEKSGGTFALAMELVEGPTLADRIARGAVPLDEAIPVAKQIADALESAHDQGIIHRDLKPANIKLRHDGTVKVLDFGLAKALDQDSRLENAGSRQAVTVTSPAVTAAGIILGTAAYMAPEQAKGRSVDARADIWAFGCVLFEMLAGRAPFAGESVVDILSTVIQRDPDWSALPAHTPAALRRLLRRCLEKDPKHRLAAIADARLELDEAARPPSADDVGALVAGPRRPTAMLAVGGALVLMTAVTSWGWWRASRVEAPAAAKGTYVAATLGVGIPNLATLTDRFAVSPDGTMLVIVDQDYGGLALRHMSALELSPIAGAPPNASAPVFSRDGKWIAFRTDAGLMKIPTQGGTPAQIAEGNDYFINLTWGADDRIRYPSLHNDAIRSVSANGGPVDTISFGPRVYVSRAEGLPNGRLLLSMMTGGENQIAVREPDGTLRKLLTGWDARLTPTGHLLFSRQEGATWSIAATAFDPATANVTGDVTVLSRDVPVRYATPAATSAAGDVFYIAGSPRSDRRVVIVDRSGAEPDIRVPPGAWIWPTASPDGLRLALGRWEGARRTLWTLTLDTGALTQVTYDDDTIGSRWMPDGKRILFAQFRIDPDQRTTSMWSVLTDGAGKIEPIAAQWDAYPGAVSSDGRTLFYSAYQSNQVQEDLMSVTLGDAAAQPVVRLATPAAEEWPTPSPDGRWLAYQTNASGTAETRVALLTDLTAFVQVSTRGGSPIRWNRDGSTLYFKDGDTVAAIDIGPRGPVLTSRRALFSVPRDWGGRLDVMPDGEHAIMIRGGPIYSDIVVMQGALTRGR